VAVINGRPAISYYDWDNQDLKFIQATDAGGAAWQVPITVDAPGIVGYYTSLAEVNGLPAISYASPTSGELKYARFAP
jgi:hypothetical protein